VTLIPGRRNDLIVRSPDGVPVHHPTSTSTSTAPAPLDDELVSWTVIDRSTWEGRSHGVPIGRIRHSRYSWSEYSIAPGAGGVTGEHSSLENAKAQLEGWARWQVRRQSAA
jgi:hypothetical protein